LAVKNVVWGNNEPSSWDTDPHDAMAMSHGPLHLAIRTRFVLDCTTQAVVVRWSFPIEQQVCNGHGDQRRSVVHLSRERIAPRDLESNVS